MVCDFEALCSIFLTPIFFNLSFVIAAKAVPAKAAAASKTASSSEDSSDSEEEKAPAKPPAKVGYNF